MLLPESMNAVTMSRFGGADVLEHGRRPLPEIGRGQVLIKVSHAGVGTWDPLEREGGFVELTGETPAFPFTPGSDGSGVIAAVGAGVEGFVEGDEVYALGGGFYAEYVAVDALRVSFLPNGVTLEEAGAMPVVALTALHGLVDELAVARGEALLITGASGDVGHIAVQLAKRLGVRVLAVASGEDGVTGARELGADTAINGRTADIAVAARRFAPAGVDAVLALIGGPSLEAAVLTVREGGRVAYPLGVEPAPKARAGIAVRGFDITLDAPATTRDRMATLNELVTAEPLQVMVSNVFPLEQAASAQRALSEHRVGKIVLSVLL